MPFQSEKQRKYLWANEPEIARDWTDKYGSRVKKDNGGILSWVPGWDEHALATNQMKIMGEPDYHAKAGFNFRENFPNVPLSVADLLADAYQTTNEGWRALTSGGDWQEAMKRASEEARLNKLGLRRQGFNVNEYQDFMNNFNIINNETSPEVSIWDAIKNEFGGSAQAAEMPNQIYPETFSHNPVGGLDQFAKEVGLLEKKYPNQTLTLDQLPGTVQDYYRNKMGVNVNDKFKITPPTTSLKEDEEEPYDFTDRLRRRGDFTTKYPSYNPWQMRAAQAPGLRRNAGRVMDFLRGPGTRLTPAQQRANQNYMTQQRITRNPQTGRMQGGLFAGQNAPGTSYFGSKTFQEMANKNLQKWGKTAPQAKVDAWKAVVTSGRDPGTGTSYTGHGKSGMGRDPRDRMARGGLASLWQR
jgi:hypothetical protein